jgi:hypothetical protein
MSISKINELLLPLPAGRPRRSCNANASRHLSGGTVIEEGS